MGIPFSKVRGGMFILLAETVSKVNLTRQDPLWINESCERCLRFRED